MSEYIGLFFIGVISCVLYLTLLVTVLVWSERCSERVVRCRDCKHFTPKGTHKFENGKVNDDFCEYVRGWMLQITPDGFCAWGERRDA